jgi:hypothetical protein
MCPHALDVFNVFPSKGLLHVTLNAVLYPQAQV